MVFFDAESNMYRIPQQKISLQIDTTNISEQIYSPLLYNYSNPSKVSNASLSALVYYNLGFAYVTP